MKRIIILALFIFVLAGFANCTDLHQDKMKKEIVQTLENQKQNNDKNNPDLKLRLSKCMQRYSYIPEVRNYIKINLKKDPGWIIKDVIFWESNNPDDKTIPWLKIISSDGEYVFKIEKGYRDRLENARRLDYLWRNPEYFDAVCTAREKFFSDVANTAFGFLKNMPSYIGKDEKGYYLYRSDDKGKRYKQYCSLKYIANFEFAPPERDGGWGSVPPRCEYTLWYLDVELNNAGMSMVKDDTYKYKCNVKFEMAGYLGSMAKIEEDYISVMNKHTTLFTLADDKDFKNGIALNFWIIKDHSRVDCADDYIYYFANHNQSHRVESKVPFKFKKYKTFKINDYITDPKFHCMEGYLF